MALGSYIAEVEHVKNYISARIDWMDNRLAYVPNADNNVFLPEVFIWSGVNTLHLEGITGEGFIRIYDLAGRVIAAKQLTDSHYSITINPGIYIVNISDKTGKSFSLKGLVR